MKRWNNFPWFFAVAVGLGLAAATFANDSVTKAGDGLGKSFDESNPGELIVHEWGTFTSFSGSNGVQLDFRPLIGEDLPDFVYDRNRQAGVPNLSKSNIRARVRMETPVTYFYTDRERTVRASVEFPDGLLTEFYPPVTSMAPALDQVSASGSPRLGQSKLDWGEIHLIPSVALTPALKDERAANWLRGMIEQRILPNDGMEGNHYYHARETDSAFVHVHHPASKLNSEKPSRDFIEKFLFYRGVGKFALPLNVVVADDDKIHVTNSGKLPIRSLFRVTVSSESITLSELDELGAGETIQFPSSERQVSSADLQAIVADALVREDLYLREALAMVKTWADSWFAEEGTRIFYMVPRETTDQILPLTISPKPDKSVRVLVGRVEVMPPSVERHLLEVVRLHAKQRAILAKRQVDEKLDEPIKLAIPTPLTKLGRLVEPALVRIRELAQDEAISYEASILMHECRAALDNRAKVEEALSTNSK